MPFIVVGLIILFIFWDELFYAIGGILGLGVLFCLFAAYGSYKGSKLSDEEWNAKYPNQERRPDTSKHYIVAALIFGTLSYFAIDYQTSTWHNPELIAQEEAAKKAIDAKKAEARAEKERLADEQRKKAIEELDKKFSERIANFNDEEKLLFSVKISENVLDGMDYNSAYEKAFNEVDEIKKIQAEKMAKAEKLAAEKAEQERRAVEEKARAEAERLAAEQKAIEEEKNKPRLRSAKIIADSIVNHAKSKFGIDSYAIADSDKLFHYSAYLMMMKLDYNNQKKPILTFDISTKI